MDDAPLRLAENIALLQRIGRNPAPPTKNEIKLEHNEAGRVLSLQHELEVVESLAYLSTYSDEPRDVMALCVEERPDHGGLIVSYATNSGLCIRLQQGIEKVASVLTQEAKSASENRVETLLKAVIIHGRNRVIGRLASAKGGNEPSTAARLKKALDLYAGDNQGAQKTYKDLYGLSKQFSNLSRDFDELKRSGKTKQCDGVLRGILKVADRMWSDHQAALESMLATIPTDKMQENLKSWLGFQIGHLGQYVPAIQRLLKRARQFSIFRCIEVRCVSLKPLSLSPYLNNPEYRIKGGLLNRYSNGSKKSRSKLSHASVTLQTFLSKHQKSLASLAKETRGHVERYQSKNEYKVHAEIQLVMDYERRTEVTRPPRVIKSSKSACFLCDLFIKAHGKFYTPKTHGRLYDRWMLPDLEGLRLTKHKRKQIVSAIDQCNDEVEEALLKAVAEEQKRRDDPRESDRFSLASSSTQRSSSAISEVARSYTGNQPEPRSRIDSIISPITPMSPRAPSLERPTKYGSPNNARDRDDERSPKASEFQYGESAIDGTPLDTIHLQRGLPSVYLFHTTSKAVRLHTPRIHFELSRSLASQIASESSVGYQVPDHKPLCIEVAWLDGSEEAAVQSEHNRSVIDLGQDGFEMAAREGILFSKSGLLIRKRAELVRLRAVEP
ncbi:hypothetical protein BDV96DRAFT_502727 [Lophiotrema nucula]|uniref:Uncharacterized protein n=1 Tax=Lophiotrema nucula TaxID=690887 RepID=A0A6A5YQW1_9PLEO|nr:hypothetical protein BDV96DRAFT_502727 [Lophiotrema nucula]